MKKIFDLTSKKRLPSIDFESTLFRSAGFKGAPKMAVKKVEGKKKVSIEKFIEAYQNPKFTRISDVAEYLGVKPSTISIRANKLKKGGVGLRDFPRVRESNLVEKAKRILDNLKKISK